MGERFPFFKELWKQYKRDIPRNLEEVEEKDGVVDIFRSNRRVFSKELLVLGVRPLESWVQEEERLVWFEERGVEKELGVLFEEEDGGRVMGVMNSRDEMEFEVGEKYIVKGVFEMVKVVRELEVYLFFRIRGVGE